MTKKWYGLFNEELSTPAAITSREVLADTNRQALNMHQTHNDIEAGFRARLEMLGFTVICAPGLFWGMYGAGRLGNRVASAFVPGSSNFQEIGGSVV